MERAELLDDVSVVAQVVELASDGEIRLELATVFHNSISQLDEASQLFLSEAGGKGEKDECSKFLVECKDEPNWVKNAKENGFKLKETFKFL